MDARVFQGARVFRGEVAVGLRGLRHSGSSVGSLSVGQSRGQVGTEVGEVVWVARREECLRHRA